MCTNKCIFYFFFFIFFLFLTNILNNTFMFPLPYICVLIMFYVVKIFLFIIGQVYLFFFFFHFFSDINFVRNKYRKSCFFFLPSLSLFFFLFLNKYYNINVAIRIVEKFKRYNRHCYDRQRRKNKKKKNNFSAREFPFFFFFPKFLWG